MTQPSTDANLPADQRLELALKGFCLLDEGRWDEARRVFEVLREWEPTDPIHEAAVGVALRGLGDLDGAERCFERAIAMDGQELAFWVNRGELNLHRGRLPDAARDFQRAVDLDPDGEEPMTAIARGLAEAVTRSLRQAGRRAAA